MGTLDDGQVVATSFGTAEQVEAVIAEHQLPDELVRAVLGCDVETSQRTGRMLTSTALRFHDRVPHAEAATIYALQLVRGILGALGPVAGDLGRPEVVNAIDQLHEHTKVALRVTMEEDDA